MRLPLAFFHTSLHSLVLLPLTLQSIACTPGALLVGDDSDAGDPSDAATQGDGDDPSCAEGATEECTCPAAEGVGNRTCSDGEFGTCKGCESADEDPRPKCVAGRYIGEGRGNARSSSAGIPGLWAPMNIEDNRAQWAFNLERSGSEEFYTVGNACMHLSNPQSGVDDGMARAFLSGEVNCVSGVLEAEMHGFYTATSLFAGPTKYYYRGRLRGTFDPESNSFVDTKFSYREPTVTVGEQPGGDGSWTAELVDDDAPIGESTQEDCLGEFPDESMFPEVTL